MKSIMQHLKGEILTPLRPTCYCKSFRNVVLNISYALYRDGGSFIKNEVSEETSFLHNKQGVDAYNKT